MVFIKHSSRKSDIFFNTVFIPCFSESRFFRAQVFQDPGVSGSSFFKVQVFQGPGFSGSRFFWVQVFQGPGFSGSRLFRVQVFLGPGFSGSGSRVRVQVLEVAFCFTLKVLFVLKIFKFLS